MTISSRSHVRSIAAATALGVALASATIGASPVLAQDLPALAEDLPALAEGLSEEVSRPGKNPTALVSNIDFKKKGSIMVHKKDLDWHQPKEPTGNLHQDAPGASLAGANFTLYKVTNADLRTNASFNLAAQLTPETAEIGDAVGRGTSDSLGHVVFGNLRVGVYLLRETGAPAGYSPAADSIVFIPMTNPEDTRKWNYDVHVYPKNSKNEVVKKVEDADQNVGDDIVYTITSDIPRVVQRDGETTTITTYQVKDDLDQTRLGAPTVTVGLSNGTTFTEGTHYDLSIDPATLEVLVEFTTDGRLALTAAGTEVKVVTTITATVLEMGVPIIINNASTITNNGGGGGDTTTESNKVETYHGKLKVIKLDKENREIKLEGAEFQLYTCTDQENLGEGPLVVGGTDIWPTDVNGTFTINALHVTDFENNAEITPTEKYCLVETKAPANYELLPNPIAIEFTREDVAETSTLPGDDAVTLVAEIENVKTVAPELPLTGGAGIGLLAALGGLIVGAGAWAARRMSRA